jgi:hypothetical protein
MGVTDPDVSFTKIGSSSGLSKSPKHVYRSSIASHFVPFD